MTSELKRFIEEAAKDLEISDNRKKTFEMICEIMFVKGQRDILAELRKKQETI